MLKPLDHVFSICREKCLRISLLGNPISDHFKDLFTRKLTSLRGGYKSVLFGVDVVCFEIEDKKRSFMPMSAFPIAYSLCDLYSTLIEYKNCVTSLFDADRIRELKRNPMLTKSERKQLESHFNQHDALLLEKFLTDYEWWGGGKTIDRGNDFFISPLMKCAKLHAETQTNIADMTCILSENPELRAALSYSFCIHSAYLRESAQQYLAAIRTKPFILLAGISGTGKSRIVRKLAQASITYELQSKETQGIDKDTFESTGRWSLQKPVNFEIIQVKPNWHNSMDVVGYHTTIPDSHYVFTPFVKFIIKAWKNPEVPFFLCLDEMNLAPVEEYFAEFLSAIESRSKENGVFKTDPIIPPFGPMKNSSICDRMIEDLDLSLQDDKDIVEHLKKDGLTLPENLIVIGTVNMDETTCSFSRKVLDRAMSFEMNEVDFDQFLKGGSDIIHEPFEKPVISNLIHRPILADEVKGNIDADGVILYLKAINGVLDGTPFKLGYRAANEALLYVDASKVFGQEDLATALDEFTLMKVLSRIEGDSSKLSVKKAYGNPNRKTLLDELKEVILERLSKHEEQAVETDMEIGVDENPNDGEPYPSEKPNTPARELMSIQKLDRMIDQLERNGFVSYWE